MHADMHKRKIWSSLGSKSQPESTKNQTSKKQKQTERTTARWRKSFIQLLIVNKTVIGEVSPADRYLYAAIITKSENNETERKTNKSAEATLQGRTVTGRLPCSPWKRDELEDVELWTKAPQSLYEWSSFGWEGPQENVGVLKASQWERAVPPASFIHPLNGHVLLSCGPRLALQCINYTHIHKHTHAALSTRRRVILH